MTFSKSKSVNTLSAKERAKLGARPRCCSESDWADWTKSNASNYAPTVADSICADCSPDYKAKMVAARRCDWPCVEFFLIPITEKDGRVTAHSIEGRRTSVKIYRGTPEGRKIIRIVDARKGIYELAPTEVPEQS